MKQTGCENKRDEVVLSSTVDNFGENAHQSLLRCSGEVFLEKVFTSLHLSIFECALEVIYYRFCITFIIHRYELNKHMQIRTYFYLICVENFHTFLA